MTMEDKTEVLNTMISGLGNPGPYQMFVFILISLNYIPVVCNNFALAFMARTPEKFACKKTNATNANLTWHSISECNLMAKDDCDVVYHFDRDQESSIVSEWDLVCSKAHYAPQAVSIYYAGVILGCLVFGVLSDRWGRRRVMLICLYSNLLLGVTGFIAPDYWEFVTVKFLHGMTLQGLQDVSFVMQLEMFCNRWRPVLATLSSCLWGVAMCWLALLAWLLPDWRHLQLALTLPSVVTLSYCIFVPETLRWLLVQQKVPQARKLLHRLIKLNRVDDKKRSTVIKSLDVLTAPPNDHHRTRRSCSVLTLFKTARLRRTTLVMFYVWFAIGIHYYCMTFGATNLPGNRFINFGLNGLVEIPCTVALPFIYGKVGRKTTFVLSLCVSAFCSIALAFLDPSVVGPYVKLTVAMLGKLSIAAAAVLLYVYTSELYPTVVRNLAMGTVAFWVRLGATAAPLINEMDQVLPPLSFQPSFLIFGVTTVVSAVLVNLLLPETKDRNMPESIEELEGLKPNSAADVEARKQEAVKPRSVEKAVHAEVAVHHAAHIVPRYHALDQENDVADSSFELHIEASEPAANADSADTCSQQKNEAADAKDAHNCESVETANVCQCS